MAAHERSLQITDIYRQRLLALRDRAGSVVADDWRIVRPADLAATHAAWVARAAAALSVVQAASVRLTGAYLTAFLRSELGAHVAAPALDERHLVGVSRTGKSIAAALEVTGFTVRQALATGVMPDEASVQGRDRASRLAVSETMATAHAALSDGMRADERITGWRRVTFGGCGACLAAATFTYGPDEPLEVHDNCRCTAEPVIADVPDTARRADGYQTFERMTPAEQDAALGPAAELVRSGAVDLRELLTTSPMAAIPDQITQAPLKALHQAQAA